MVIAAIVFGITSVIVSLISLMSYGMGGPLGVLIGLVGMIFSFLGRREVSNRDGGYMIGLVLSLSGVCIGVINFAVYINTLSRNTMNWLTGLL